MEITFDKIRLDAYIGAGIYPYFWILPTETELLLIVISIFHFT